MKRYVYSALLVLLVCVPSISLAWEGVEVVASSASLGSAVSGIGSPIPNWCTWYSEGTGIAGLSATNADGIENDVSGCRFPWELQCASDGVTVLATWPANTSGWVYAAQYDVSLTCDVSVAEESKLLASLQVIGNLTDSSHTLNLRSADGTEISVIDSVAGVDSAALIVAPGAYTITVSVYALQAVDVGDVIGSYSSFMQLQWSDPSAVAIDEASWGTLKSLFR